MRPPRKPPVDPRVRESISCEIIEETSQSVLDRLKWVYYDKEMKEHGPFYTPKMRAWYQGKYFTSERSGDNQLIWVALSHWHKIVRVTDLWPDGQAFETIPNCSEFFPLLRKTEEEEISDAGSTGLESPMRRFSMKSLPRNPDSRASKALVVRRCQKASTS